MIRLYPHLMSARFYVIRFAVWGPVRCLRVVASVVAALVAVAVLVALVLAALCLLLPVAAVVILSAGLALAAWPIPLK